ncbi:hypothetical protein HK098_002141 [Nowakowskiella sp. JEL0407]|nr:hypothetical protein HK098_002141 [Nowakowskiella sp. JEL0407]
MFKTKRTAEELLNDNAMVDADHERTKNTKYTPPTPPASPQTKPNETVCSPSYSSRGQIIPFPITFPDPLLYTSPLFPQFSNRDKATYAIQYGMRTNTKLNTFNIHHVIGWGTNGVVLAASKPEQPHQLLAVKLIYKPRDKPAICHEIWVHTFLAQKNESNLLLNFVESFQDDLTFYLVTENFGTDWSTALIPDSAVSTKKHDRMTYHTIFNTTATIPIFTSDTDLFSFNKAISMVTPTRKIPRKYLKPVFQQIALSLHLMHKNGVIHNDIKEENVLVEVGETVLAKLCDYGHCRLCGCERKERNFECMRYCSETTVSNYGTVQLTPPELLSHYPNRVDGFPADVWALGIVLLGMLKGKFPETCESIMKYRDRSNLFVHELNKEICSVLEKTKEEWKDDPKDYKCVSQLVWGMLEEDPELRLTMDQIVDHQWIR